MTDPRFGALPRDVDRAHIAHVPLPTAETPAFDAFRFQRLAAQEWLAELLRGAAVEHQGMGTRVGAELVALRSTAAYLEETESDGLEFWVQIGEHTFSVAVEHL